MPQLDLTFLSTFAVTVDDTPVTDFATDKVRALLAYIALEANQPHRRSTLAGLLWPDITENKARNNIRVTLHRLRQTLDKAIPKLSDQLFTITRQTIQFNTELDPQLNLTIRVDVTLFQTLVAASEAHGHDQLHTCQSCLASLTEAANLYRGELLSGFNLGDAPTFEEWLVLQRAMIEQQGFKVLQTLADAYEEQTDYDQAVTYVHQLLQHDPYREATHRQLMRLFAYRGLPDQAIAQYAACQQLLRDELGIDPAPETDALFALIREGNLHPPQAKPEVKPINQVVPIPNPGQVAPSALTRSQRQSLLDVPDPGPFFGRRTELDQLQQWLIEDHCRIVAILGIGGVGKTSLAAQCIRTLVNSPIGTNFEVILWRSLLNAPPLTELLPPLLQILSDQQMTTPPKSVDEQLRLLIGYLRDKRVLLVLDNMESIMEAEYAGAYRAGYEPYGQLIEQIATLTHQSHLLLTSRERPSGYARLVRDSNRIKSFRLVGLDDEAGRELLDQRRLAGVGKEQTTLIARYSGNPLALKLVADTVDEVFGGDLAGFMADDSLIFDDIRSVLDQHFARLTDLEQQILFWLAVEREPVLPQLLRESLLQSPKQRDVVEALRSLQRRSLMERQGNELALQNVVTEYLTDRLIESVCTELETGHLNRLHQHALCKAQAKTYVRESQERLILRPIGERLSETLGRSKLQTMIQQILIELRATKPPVGDYAAGNLLNLLLYLNVELADIDFSSLQIRQAYLQDASLINTNFSHVEFTESRFTSDFGRVRAIAFSPDDQLLAIGTDDGIIRLWRLADGQLVNILADQQAGVSSVEFSPDGRRLISSNGGDSTIRLWDVVSSERLLALGGHQKGNEIVTFNPDGSVVASGGQDGTIRLWDARTGKLLQALKKHTDWVTSLAFHPSGELLVSGGLNEPCYYLWQCQIQRAAPSEPVEWHCHFAGTLPTHNTACAAAAFNPDGTLLATSDKNTTVTLWDVAQRKIVGMLREPQAHARFEGRFNMRFIAFSPDGTLLATGGKDTHISLWDVASGQILNVLQRHEKQIWDIAISGDGKMLASGGTEGLVYLWDLHDPRKAQVVRSLHGHIRPIRTLKVHPQGNLFATSEKGGAIRVWQLASDRGEMRSVKVLTGHTDTVDDLAFSTDGSWLGSGSHDNTTRLWDVESGACITVIPTGFMGGSHITFAPDGKMMAYAYSDKIYLVPNARARVFSSPLMLTGHTHNIRAICFSPDGKYLASCAIDNTVRLWDVATGTCLHIFDQDVFDFWSLMFSPNGTLLAGGGRTGIHIWDLGRDDRGRIHFSAMAEIINIRAVAFSPIGQYLVSGGSDRMVRIWDLEDDIERHCLAGHTSVVTSTAFLPDGDTVISASYDGTVRLWDVQTGTCLQTASIPGPYEGLNITGVKGISEAQRVALKALGAVETR